MDFIQPLALKVWILQVFAGNPDIFGAIAVFVIAMMSGYFRMNGISLFFMLGLFILMFSGFIGVNFLVLFAILGGLVIGYTISKVFQ